MTIFLGETCRTAGIAALLVGVIAPNAAIAQTEGEMAAERADAPRVEEAPDSRAKISEVPSIEPKFDVDLSASTRLRVDAFDNPSFGLTIAEDFASFQYRATARADVSHSSGLSASVETGYYDETGRSPGPRVIDRNRGELLQASLSYAASIDDWTVSGTIGRQLNPQGNSRLNSKREAPNAYRSFDGVSIIASSSDWRLSAFALHPVAFSPNFFDDEPDSTEAFWGLYVSHENAIGDLSLDAYYLGRADEQVVWTQGQGEETRHSLGMRAYGEGSQVAYNLEAIYQFGNFEGANIDAWGLAGELSFQLPGTVSLGVRGNVVSGDRDRADSKLQSFSAIYPRFTYYSPAASIAPSNAFDVQLFATAQPAPELSLRTSLGTLHKLESADAIYRVPYVPLAGTDGVPRGASALIGTASLRWAMNNALTLNASITSIQAREVIDRAGGTDQFHAMLSVSAYF